MRRTGLEKLDVVEWPMLAGDTGRDCMGGPGPGRPILSETSGVGVTAGGLRPGPLLPPSHALTQQAFAASGMPVLGGLDLLVGAVLDPLGAGVLVAPA